MSSASEILERGGGGSSSDRGDYAPEEDWQGAGTLQRARLSQRMSGKGSNQPGRAGSSASGGSRSPLTEFSTAASSPPVPTHPLQSAQSGLPPRREASPARSFDMGQPASPTSASGSQAYSRGNSTPTAISAQSSSTYYPPSASADAGPSRWEDASSLGLSVSDEMDDATRALIEQIQREERKLSNGKRTGGVRSLQMRSWRGKSSRVSGNGGNDRARSTSSNGGISKHRSIATSSKR